MSACHPRPQRGGRRGRARPHRSTGTAASCRCAWRTRPRTRGRTRRARCSSAASSGEGSSAACPSRLSMHRMAVLEFTPRGSNPTMSKRLRSAAGKRLAGPVADEVHARSAGPAGIDEQRPDPARLVGRGHPDHRNVEGALRGCRVVARDTDLRTLESVPAIAPSHGAHREAGRAGWAGEALADGSATLDGTATTDAGGVVGDGVAGLHPATRRTATKAACRRFAWPRQVIRPGAYPTAPHAHPREGHARGWDHDARRGSPFAGGGISRTRRPFRVPRAVARCGPRRASLPRGPRGPSTGRGAARSSPRCPGRAGAGRSVRGSRRR